MASRHFRTECKHGVLIAQCRCPSPEKELRIAECPPSCSDPVSNTIQDAVLQARTRAKAANRTGERLPTPRGPLPLAAENAAFDSVFDDLGKKLADKPESG